MKCLLRRKPNRLFLHKYVPTVTPVCHSRLKLMARKLQSRPSIAPLCPSGYPPRNLTLPWASLGLAAIYEIEDCQVAQKQLLQPTQMWDWLWRDRTKVFCCTKDEPSLDLLSECINDVCVCVCVQRKSAS